VERIRNMNMVLENLKKAGKLTADVLHRIDKLSQYALSSLRVMLLFN